MERRNIYMDHMATTPVDPRVLDQMLPFFTEHYGNAASLQHRYGWVAKEAVERSRQKIADFIGGSANDVIFTGGATESNNLAVKGVAEAYRSKGNHIVTTQIEHKCVLESCRHLEKQGWNVTYLPVDDKGRVRVQQVADALTEQTVLVSVMAANNEIGTVQPIADIGKLCADRNILFHTDATQGVGRLPINVETMNIHLLSFSGHKLYGPKGVGVLYRRGRNPRVGIDAQMDGAGHEQGLRSGTLNVPAIVGLGKAVQLLNEEQDAENGRLSALRNRLQEKLSSIESVTVNGDLEYRLPHLLSITFHGVNADRLMNELNGVAVSAGSACTSEETGAIEYSHVLRAIGADADAGRQTIRFGLGRFTTTEEVDDVAQRIAAAVPVLRERYHLVAV